MYKKLVLKIIFICFLQILFFNFSIYAYNSNFIKVLLAEKQQHLDIYSNSEIKIFNETGKILNITNTYLKFYIKNNNLFINDLPINEKILILISKNYLKFNSRFYRGKIVVKNNSEGLMVINKLPLEEYLYGIMKMEVSPAWDIEALKTQAVVSRTYALKNINKYATEGYDLKPTVMDQVYAGVNGEDERSNAAVFETAGEVITYKSNLAEVFFYADAGGYTENIQDVWGSTLPYLQAIKINFPSKSPYKKWQIKYSITKFIQNLKKSGYNITAIYNIYVLERTSSGRAKFVKIETPQGSLTLKGETLRKILGYDVLKSTLFKIQFKFGGTQSNIVIGNNSVQIKIFDKTKNISDIFTSSTDNLYLLSKETLSPFPDIYYLASTNKQLAEIRFTGSGWGHGVGMSQWDTKAMADMGYSYKEIINFFFPGTEVKKIF